MQMIGIKKSQLAACLSAPCFAAQPLPELPPLQEREEYQPAVVQQHLSLWDSLHFTGKVSKQECQVV